MTEGARLKRIDESLVSLERLAADQGAFNDRLIERLDRGAAGALAGLRELSRMNGLLERQGDQLERQGDRVDRQLDLLERQGDRLERQGEALERLEIELDRRAGERRAESKMEREALLRILERLDDVDPGRGRSSGSN